MQCYCTTSLQYYLITTKISDYLNMCLLGGGRSGVWMYKVLALLLFSKFVVCFTIYLRITNIIAIFDASISEAYLIPSTLSLLHNHKRSKISPPLSTLLTQATA